MTTIFKYVTALEAHLADTTLQLSKVHGAIMSKAWKAGDEADEGRDVEALLDQAAEDVGEVLEALRFKAPEPPSNEEWRNDLAETRYTFKELVREELTEIEQHAEEHAEDVETWTRAERRRLALKAILGAMAVLDDN